MEVGLIHGNAAYPHRRALRPGVWDILPRTRTRMASSALWVDE
jgi:hypothetical protein